MHRMDDQPVIPFEATQMVNEHHVRHRETHEQRFSKLLLLVSPARTPGIDHQKQIIDIDNAVMRGINRG